MPPAVLEVFKFGGASVRGPEGVRNVCKIVRAHRDRDLVVVVSAMGKTTNALEGVLEAFRQGATDTDVFLDKTLSFHRDIARQLELSEAFFSEKLDPLFTDLEAELKKPVSDNAAFDYDRIVSFGEVFSCAIMSGFLTACGVGHSSQDARTLIRTDDTFREAKVDWPSTEGLIKSAWARTKQGCAPNSPVLLTQGFIGHTTERRTTTLGREGSDFSAAIFAFALNAQRITIWKDVPGMLNADPKYFPDAVTLPLISYKEAIELAYYGASVIHPKTIQPAQNKNIPISVRSFLHPEKSGSEIGPREPSGPPLPAFIIKQNQVLMSFTTRDFSFVAEEQLSELFGLFSRVGTKVHLMQNSAINFSVVSDYDALQLQTIRRECEARYEMYYNKPCELITIRHYDTATIDRLLGTKKVLLEQRSRSTARFVAR